jgi:Family of unknown function (DUF6338)
MPTTLFGVLLFLAGIGPGYVYVRIAERREPQVRRSALLEAAGLLVIGGLTTGLAALIVLIATDATGLMNVEALIKYGTRYVASEPLPVLVAVFITLLLSYTGAIGLALIVYRGRKATVYPNRSVWWEAIGEAKNAGPVFATLELRDGRVVDGYVHAYTIDPDTDRRDMSLQRPIFVRPSGRVDRTPLNVDYLVLPDTEIVYVSLQRAGVHDPRSE